MPVGLKRDSDRAVHGAVTNLTAIKLPGNGLIELITVRGG
jgi:hypothetical protein